MVALEDTASVDIPFGTTQELSARMSQLADDVLRSDPWTREGEDARRLLRIAVKQLDLKAKITGTRRK
jgi:hypothetical protein